MLQTTIEDKLNKAFSPTYLNVINESYMHNVPEGSESHFKVVIVSDSFEATRLIARHRQVNLALAHELKNHIHALSIHVYTCLEWQDKQNTVADSPPCMGGGQ
ncbi:transcriptional regulator BolA [Vibrio sp. 10N.286.49.B3]|uniref:transcriptional regulator BolA n=1 Tax=Vibrio sp. 10N.286.49.B3 TaxID=1880855 RepID=UPI000C81FD12|nr:transcriptional regulator BolA [Vibrio sp. 10N.286.49.B3]PMH41146.1 transcriptional regulator BolA [Vibrio sp. 10N.286.49.B3]